MGFIPRQILALLIFVVGSPALATTPQALVQCAREALVAMKEKIEPEDSYRLLEMAGTPIGGQVASSVKNGKSVDEALQFWNVPAWARPHFDPLTGEFRYRPQAPLPLALENGDLPLSAVRINFADAEFSGPVIADYVQVMKHMKKLELWILGDSSRRKAISRALSNVPAGVRRRIRVFSEHFHEGKELDVSLLSMWAQDASKPLAPGTGSPTTLLPPTIGNYGEASEAAVYSLENTGAAGFRRTEFRFDGGDVVVGSRHIFVGPAVVDQAVADLKITRNEAIQALSAEFGKPVVEAGRVLDKVKDGVVPIDFHIDLFMAVARNRLTGREAVLLESPRLSLKLLAKRKQSRQLTSTESQIFDVLRNQDPKVYREREDALTVLEQQYREMGYDVVRIPGLNMNQYGRDPRGKKLQVFGWANSIFSESTAIVPDMGVPALDQYARSALRKLGYREIHSMKSSRKTFCKLGGIRCVSETYRANP